MKNKISVDGTAHNAISRKLRLLTLMKWVCNFIGFLLLMIHSYYFQGNQEYQQTMELIFTLLMIIQISMYVATKIFSFKEQTIMNGLQKKQQTKTFTIIMKLFVSTQILSQIWHVFMLFFQPTIFYPSWINHNLFSLTLIRIYLLFEYYFDYKHYRNPQLQRVGKEFGVDIKLFCFKIGFTKKFFLLKILEIMFFVLFGLGNIMKRYDESLEDVFEVIYFVVVSMSTVGYGDIVMDNSFSKVICVFCLLLGYIATSLVMYKILNSTGLNLKEEGVYNLNEKIKHFEDKRQYVIECIGRNLNKAKQKQNIQTLLDDNVIKKNIKYNTVQQQGLDQLINKQAQLQYKNNSILTSINLLKRIRIKIHNMNLFNQYFQLKNLLKQKKKRKGLFFSPIKTIK